jgi:Mg2+ and Co2+ transporter CorA
MTGTTESIEQLQQQVWQQRDLQSGMNTLVTGLTRIFQQNANSPGTIQEYCQEIQAHVNDITSALVANTSAAASTSSGAGATGR